MFQSVKIAPSILSADFMHLGDDIDMIERAGAGLVHVDVMDGHFVPNLTMGVAVLEQLSLMTNLPTDVHLMVDNPLEQIPWFVEAGADSITVHAEVLDDAGLACAIKMIRDQGVGVGIALKPSTDVQRIVPVISDVDTVVIMSVEPGFSGQRFIAGSQDKIVDVCDLATEANADPRIELDGGIGLETAPLVCAVGADVLVCGNAIFGADDPENMLASIKDAGDQARLRALEEVR